MKCEADALLTCRLRDGQYESGTFRRAGVAALVTAGTPTIDPMQTLRAE